MLSKECGSSAWGPVHHEVQNAKEETPLMQVHRVVTDLPIKSAVSILKTVLEHVAALRGSNKISFTAKSSTSEDNMATKPSCG